MNTIDQRYERLKAASSRKRHKTKGKRKPRIYQKPISNEEMRARLEQAKKDCLKTLRYFYPDEF